MKYEKKLTLASLAIASMVIIGGSAGIAQAHGVGRDLNPQKVEQHKLRMERRLDQAVKDGKITQEQRDQIDAKLKENHEQLKEIKEIDNKDQRHEKVKEMRDSMQQWLKDHNINLQMFMPKPFRK